MYISNSSEAISLCPAFNIMIVAMVSSWVNVIYSSLFVHVEEQIKIPLLGSLI